MFHQVEGFWVAENANFAALKGVLADFMQQFFERDNLPVRFRASFFLYRALGGNGHWLRDVPEWLPGVQSYRLARSAGLRHGAPERSQARWHRQREIYWLCLWDGCGTACHVEIRCK